MNKSQQHHSQNTYSSTQHKTNAKITISTASERLSYLFPLNNMRKSKIIGALNCMNGYYYSTLHFNTTVTPEREEQD